MRRQQQTEQTSELELEQEQEHEQQLKIEMKTAFELLTTPDGQGRKLVDGGETLAKGNRLTRIILTHAFHAP
ncbi:GH22154 [Drosophila grimshawi]|uniref:GH22154 n=1 Tax=Drosophila grimshawi TaxID=7222 RepID=B4J4N6_DROGR|nr:GH22154 [Drosophila grimshawi]